MIRDMLETMRPRQWTKNLVVFAGLLFDGQMFKGEPFLRVLLAFVLFCLISGLTYTINDLMDVEADRKHPQKKNRPIASGRLSTKVAIGLAFGLALTSFPLAFWLSWKFGLIALAYTLLILAYSVWLKQVLIIDAMVIAAGFVLRVLGGVSVITVNNFSPWLYVLTSLLALFLAFGKRLSEAKLLEDQAGEVRKVLKGYSAPLLNQYLMIITAAILITYTLYTFSSNFGGHNFMLLTVPFVIYGIFRYLYILQVGTGGANPEEVLLKDRPLRLTILLWGVAVVLVLYRFF